MEPSSEVVSFYKIRGAACRNGGYTIPKNLPEYISVYKSLKITCKYGHWEYTLAGQYNGRCELCRLVKLLKSYDFEAKCLHNEYKRGIAMRVMVVCHRGHKSIEDLSKVNPSRGFGCQTCHLLSTYQWGRNANWALDTVCVYAHHYSRLRFHCTTVHHNPECPGPKCSTKRFSPDCNNAIVCGRDFYIIPAAVKMDQNPLSCPLGHIWPIAFLGQMAAVRVFETLFNDRFDDRPPCYHIEFTGYNIKLGIAYTHMADNGANKYVAAAQQWCAVNHIVFVVIDKDLEKASRITTSIVNQLDIAGCLPDPTVTAEEYITLIRTQIRAGNKKKIYFENRCVF